ncbi:ribosomal RNA large subunit methyltransferase H [Halomonas elongata]|uniref:Ribosomal RNA large subunit methyltransferase H n=1 Tax=Halomonas elongata TaxID=2746 RepID=A0A1B8P3S4_HALEL|nr:ribosomal RNA large subunit methyltransferase H [Halomonas elongata]
MRVRLLAVGTRMPDWVTRGVEEYRKRLPRDFALEIEEISPGARGKNADTRRAMALEAERIRARLKGDEYRVALEVGARHGAPSSSPNRPSDGGSRDVTWPCWSAARTAWNLPCRRRPTSAGRFRP